MPSKVSSQHQENSLLDAVREVMMTLDLNLQIQWANQMAGDLIKDHSAPLVGQYCHQVICGQQATCEECSVQMTIQTGEPQEREREAPDGRYYNVRSYPLYSREGIIDGVAVVGMDITERKRAEKERDREAEKQQILLDNIHTLVWYLVDERTYGAVNLARAEFQGFAPEDMSFKDLYDLYPQDVAETCHQGNIEVFSTGNPVLNEEWVPHVSGEWRLLSILKSPKLRSDGAVEYVVCSAEDITERKQNKERLHKIYNNTHDAIIIHDRDGRIIDVNDSMCQTYHLNKEEALSCTIMDISSSNMHTQDLLDIWSKVLSNQKQFFEWEALRPKDKSIFHVEVSLQKIDLYNESFIIANIRDVTKSKQKEKALRRSESYYRAIFETSAAAMFIIEEETIISLVNTNFEKLSGYSRQEVEGKKSWTEFLHPDDAEWIKKYHYLRRQDPEAAPRQYEFRFMTHSGEWRNLSFAIDIIPETNRSIGSGIDITERKQAEEELRKREEHMQAILQAAPDPLIIYDSIGHPQYINPAFCEVFGWTMEELQNQRIPFVPEDQKELTFSKIQEIYKTGTPVKFDTKRFTKDNRLLDIRVSAAIIRSSLYEHYGLVVHLTDITQRKELEQKLREMSIYDSLTGLYNRNFFEEEMKRLSNGRHDPLGIIVCDLDGLKFLNDTLGHQTGDRMLVTIAEILRQNFRSSDIIARIGGDEFAVLLTETDSEVVELILQRLRQAVQDYNNQEPEIPLSLSMGHALGAGATDDMQEIFREADNRMYREKIQRAGSARNDILQALTGSMQARDFDTEGHCKRLQERAASLARSLELSQELVNDLFLLARFHDLGKVGIPDHILFKPGGLTEKEWQQMRQHCEIGHRIASSVPNLEPIADYILKHHEWWDGRGYPLGLAGEDIPLLCRILAIADAYDAMTSDRPYRSAMTREEAIAELRRCAGRQFDPELVERFIKTLKDSDGRKP